MHRKGAIGMPVKLIAIVTIVLIVLFVSFGGVAWAKGLWADAPISTREDTAKELCKLSCAKADSARTCKEWQNDFCHKPYIDENNCSSLVQTDALVCDSPIDDCHCIFEDEWVD